MLLRCGRAGVIKLFLPFPTVAAVTLRGSRKDFCDRASVQRRDLALTVMCLRSSPRESPPPSRVGLSPSKKSHDLRERLQARVPAWQRWCQYVGLNSGWRERCRLHPSLQRRIGWCKVARRFVDLRTYHMTWTLDYWILAVLIVIAWELGSIRSRLGTATEEGGLPKELLGELKEVAEKEMQSLDGINRSLDNIDDGLTSSLDELKGIAVTLQQLQEDMSSR